MKEENEFIKKIEDNSVRLGDIATIKETIHTGNVRSKLIVDENLMKIAKKLLAGKDCHRYWFKWNGKYIRYDQKLIDKNKGEYGNLCAPDYFEKTKILLRDISKYPEAVIDCDGYYSVNTLYSIQLKSKELNMSYLLAVLNSRLISFYFEHRFEDTHVSGGFLRFKNIYLPNSDS